MSNRDIHGKMLSARWENSKLDRDRKESIELFILERMAEPLEAYLSAYEKIIVSVDTLMSGSVDLTLLRENAHVILSNKEAIRVFCYLPGPPVSDDDLRTLVGQNVLNPRQLKIDPELLNRLLSTVMDGLDRRRFPWILDGRMPTSEKRYAAIIATTALMATQQVTTSRRNTGKKVQEAAVKEALQNSGLTAVTGRKIAILR